MRTIQIETSDTPNTVTWEERLAQLRALDELPDPEIDYSDIPRLTEDDFARSVRVCDYPSEAIARQEARKLRELQEEGWTNEQLREYKAKRVRELQEQAATV
jgi:hypothetical protein